VIRLRDCLSASALAATVVLILAASAFAQGTHGPSGPMTFEQFKAAQIEQMHHMMARVDQRLARADLTDEQRQRLMQTKTRLDRLQSLSPDQLNQMLRSRFDKIDTAHTGTITPEQIRAFRQQERRSGGDDFWPAQQ